jgi:hypothetical protein
MKQLAMKGDSCEHMVTLSICLYNWQLTQEQGSEYMVEQFDIVFIKLQTQKI